MDAGDGEVSANVGADGLASYLGAGQGGVATGVEGGGAGGFDAGLLVGGGVALGLPFAVVAAYFDGEAGLVAADAEADANTAAAILVAADFLGEAFGAA